jgi:O-antigen ligase
MMHVTFASIRPVTLMRAPAASCPARHFLAFAAFLYLLSAQSFCLRDPLGASMGWNAYLQLALFFSAFSVGAGFWLMRGLLVNPPASFWCFVAVGLMGLASAPRSFMPELSVVKAVLFCCVIVLVELLCSAWSPSAVLRSIYGAMIAVYLFGLALGVALPDTYPLTVVEEYTGRQRLALFTFAFGDFAYLTGAAFLLGRLPCIRAPWYTQFFLFALTVASGSKTCTVGLLVVWGFAQLRRLRAIKVLFAALCVAAAGLLTIQVLLNADSLIGTRILSALQVVYGDKLVQESQSLNGRFELWDVVALAGKNCLFLGFGFDGARDRILRLIPWAGQSHNGFLEFFLAAGLPGLMAFLAGWLSAVRSALASPFGTAALPIYFYLLIVANTDPIFTMFQCYGLFMILALHYWVRQPVAERVLNVRRASEFTIDSAPMRVS